MLLLTSSSDAVQIVTSSAANVDLHASWVDMAGATITPGRVNSTVASAATSSLVTGPGSGQRNVKTLTARNRHATLSCDVTVKHTDGTTAVELYKATLAPNQSLEYDGEGFISTTFVQKAGDTMTGDLTISKASPRLALYGDGSGTGGGIVSFSNGASARWVWNIGNPETGGDAGSDLLFSRYHDNGSIIDTPFYFIRATASISFGGDVTISKAQPLLHLSSTVSGNLAALFFERSGTARWAFALQADAETGGNAGSSCALGRYNDAGTWIDNPFQISRATGRMQCNAVQKYVDTLPAQNALINGKIVESHASNAATFAVKTLAGSDPSASDPVGVMYGDGTLRTLAAALSLTVPSGAFAVGNNVPFRLWFAIVDDAGTQRLAVRFCTSHSYTAGYVGGVLISGFPPNGALSSTAISSSATTWVSYTDVAVSAKQYKVIGFADYDSGLVTGGQFAVSPTRLVQHSHGMPLPGQILQEYVGQSFTQTTTTGTSWAASSINATVAPADLFSVFEVSFSANAYGYAMVSLWGHGVSLTNNCIVNSAQYGGAVAFVGVMDRPFTLSNVSYGVFFYSIDGVSGVFVPWSDGHLIIRELMG